MADTRKAIDTRVHQRQRTQNDNIPTQSHSQTRERKDSGDNTVIVTPY